MQGRDIRIFRTCRPAGRRMYSSCPRPGYLGVAYHVSGLMDFDVEIDIPGTFSVYNSLTAIAVCRHFGVPVEKIKEALKKAKVKGASR